MELSTEKPLTAKQQRAAEIKERNRVRLAKLKAEKAKRAKAKEAKKTAERSGPTPAQLERAAKKSENKAKHDAKAAVREAATEELVPIAKEVNHRFAEAAKLDGKADDHRLAAALQLKAAEEKCRDAGIAFKAWSDKNVAGHSYETVRQLLAVGKAENPKLALEDLRKANAAANRKHRAAKKAAAGVRLTPDSDVHFTNSAGEEGGPVVVTAAEGGRIPLGSSAIAARDAELKVGGFLSGVEGLKAAFAILKASDKMAFVEWAALEIGAVLKTEFDEAPPPLSREAVEAIVTNASEAVADALEAGADPAVKPDAKPAKKPKLVRRK